MKQLLKLTKEIKNIINIELIFISLGNFSKK